MLNNTLDQWKILDARPKSRFKAGHLPGAVSFSWEHLTKTDKSGVPHRILPGETLADLLGSLGIHNQSPIAVYGDADSSWGGEGWILWMLTWMGHEGPVRLLDGGIKAWRKNRYLLETKPDAIPVSQVISTVSYTPSLNYSVNITARDIQNSKEQLQLVDTRSTLEWIRNRIPGAVHISWKNFHKGKNRRTLNAGEMVQLLKNKGINPDIPVVYFCTGGIRSGYAWMVHELAGLPGSVNYEGGIEEWKRTKAD